MRDTHRAREREREREKEREIERGSERDFILFFATLLYSTLLYSSLPSSSLLFLFSPLLSSLPSFVFLSLDFLYFSVIFFSPPQTFLCHSDILIVSPQSIGT